jgi:hypothetical protein
MRELCIRGRGRRGFICLPRVMGGEGGKSVNIVQTCIIMYLERETLHIFAHESWDVKHEPGMNILH